MAPSLLSILLIGAAVFCAAASGAHAATARPPPKRSPPPPKRSPSPSSSPSPSTQSPPRPAPVDPLAPYSIGLWGDLPYSDTQATVGMPNLIADINSHDLAFTIMDGDLKQGSNYACSDAMYNRSLAFFNSLKAPAAFTPGDNDWVDCDRANNGGYNSLERLDYERKVFFGDEYTLGQSRLKQEVQSAPLCPGYSASKPYPLVPCVENRRWMYNGVMYMTVNVQGSCNNLCDTNPDPEEFAGRNAANIVWLNETFAAAKTAGAAAVMIVSQATPGWDATDATRTMRRDPKTLKFLPPRVAADGSNTCGDGTDSPDGYEAWLLAVRAQTIEFAKPVVYVHGDSHYFRVDKPLLDRNGNRVQFFTRVETPGDHAETGNDDVTWVKVNVDARSREVFSFSPMLVPANMPAYAARRLQA